MKVDEDIQAVHQQIASAYQLMAIKVGYRPRADKPRLCEPVVEGRDIPKVQCWLL